MINLFRNYKSRKYLRKILLSVSILLIIVVLLTSIVFYFQSERMVLNMQREANEKVLHQMNYNIDYMSEMIKFLAVQIYTDNEFIPFLSSVDIETMEQVQKIQRLRRIANSSTYLHSIIIYNGYKDKVYATDETYVEPTFFNKYGEQEQIPKLKFVPNKMGEGQPEIFSMFMYEDYRDKSVIALTIRPEWLYDNIEIISNFAGQAENNILMMNNEGTIFGNNDDLVFSSDELRSIIFSNLETANQGSRFITAPINGEKKLITFVDSSSTDWYIINIQSYDTVLKNVHQFRDIIILITSLFLIISIASAIFLSFNLYRPIENIVKKIRPDTDGNNPSTYGHDELLYLSNTFRTISSQYENTKTNVVKYYQLRKLITDSNTLSFEEFTSCVRDSKININVDGFFKLIIINIDQYENLSKKDNVDMNLYKFAITNIMNELLTKEFTSETISMRQQDLVTIISADLDKDYTDKTIISLIKEAQEIVKEYYDISLSFTLTETILNHKDICFAYNKGLKSSQYSLVYGMSSIITPEMVEKNESKVDIEFPRDLEQRLIEELKINDVTKMNRTIKDIFEHIATLNYDNMIYSILHIIVIINSTLRSINNHQIEPIRVDLKKFYQQVLEKETLVELQEMFQQLLDYISLEVYNKKSSKDTLLVVTIKKMIEGNYMDCNLNQQYLASMLKMSSAHIGKVFKTNEDMTILEYIKEVRLKHSLKLIENTDLSIKEIMEGVGYTNESQFYRVFKKQYGVTPGQLKLNSAIKLSE